MKIINCMVCPNGCQLNVIGNIDDLSTQGNKCNKGAEFALLEISSSMRTLTTTVRTSLPEANVLPVRTDGEIPKELFPEAMKILNKMTISHELDCGDTVLDDLAGSGVRVIATSDILLRSNTDFESRNSGLDNFSTGAGGGGYGIVKNTGVSSLDGVGDPYNAEPDGVLDIDDINQDDGERDFLSAAEDATETPGQKGRSHIRNK